MAYFSVGFAAGAFAMAPVCVIALVKRAFMAGISTDLL